MTKHIANILTGCRILGSVLLLFFPVFSTAFYSAYLFCGISDMIDGTVARRTGSDGKLGSQLDTAADFVFVAVSFGKLLPTVHVPCWLWVWGGAIAMVKIGTILWRCISKKQFVSHHTAMNKITGFLLFLTPLTFSFAELQYSAAVVCAVATVAAIQESFYVITDPT